MSARATLGGTVMAQGLAMIRYLSGWKTCTPSFSEYIIPTAKDIPHKNVDYLLNALEKLSKRGQGLGEHALYLPALLTLYMML